MNILVQLISRIACKGRVTCLTKRCSRRLTAPLVWLRQASRRRQSLLIFGVSPQSVPRRLDAYTAMTYTDARVYVRRNTAIYQAGF